MDQHSMRVLSVVGGTANINAAPLTKPDWARAVILRLNCLVGTTVSITPRVSGVGPDGTVVPILTYGTPITAGGTVANYYFGNGTRGPGPGSNLPPFTIVGGLLPKIIVFGVVHGNANPADYTLDFMWA